MFIFLSLLWSYPKCNPTWANKRKIRMYLNYSQTVIVKNKVRDPKGSHFCYAPSFSVSKECNLKPVNLELLGQHPWGHLPDRLCQDLREGDLATTDPLFASITCSSHSCLPVRVFHFVQLLGAPFYVLDEILFNSWIAEWS